MLVLATKSSLVAIRLQLVPRTGMVWVRDVGFE